MMGMHVVDEQEDELGTPSESSSAASSSSDSLDDDATSPSSSSSSGDGRPGKNPLCHMSDLLEELPIKRGLSEHFRGKSRSFASLSSARRLEDLVKAHGQPRRPVRKRMRSSGSYGGGPEDRTSRLALSPKGCCSRIISKRPPSSSAVERRHPHHLHIGFHAPRPPTHPHHSSADSLPGQALLFA